MKNTIENLYFGNVAPTEKPLPKNQEFRKAMSAAQSARDRLRKELNDKQKALLDEFIEKDGYVSVHKEFDSFLQGFRLASQLMVEALVTKDEE